VIVWEKISGPFRDFGLAAGALYAIDRVISGVSPKLRLHVYDLVVQPIARKPLVPDRVARQLEIRVIEPGDPELALMPVRPEVMQARLAQKAVCLGAFKKGALVGYMWFCSGRYEEDEVRCTYVLGHPGESVFDFDFYLFPEHRMGFAFAILWNGANEFLGRRGIRHTFSRMTRFNLQSRRAHQRLGLKIVGRALFLQAWALEVMVATLFPFLHVSMSKAGRVRLTLAK
jgi:hypothetical protein